LAAFELATLFAHVQVRVDGIAKLMAATSRYPVPNWLLSGIQASERDDRTDRS
jgi:hypothetical protein